MALPEVLVRLVQRPWTLGGARYLIFDIWHAAVVSMLHLQLAGRQRERGDQ